MQNENNTCTENEISPVTLDWDTMVLLGIIGDEDDATIEALLEWID